MSMEFIRSDVRDFLWRWREAIIGFAISMLGIYWALDGIGFISILGTSLAIAGALLVFAGIQRARFRIGNGGAGIVQIIEGQVTYYGPIEGGSVAIADLKRVDLNPGEGSNSEWVLHDLNSAPLKIPTNAEGAEALFDVFAGLEGLQTEKMLGELTNAPEQQVVIWQSNPVTLH